MKDKKKKLTEYSDEELMLDYKLGSFEAFDHLYCRNAPKIFGYLSSKLSSKNQIDDIHQETFLRLHKFRAKYDSTFPFLPWLFTICRNSMVDYLRSTNRVLASDLVETGNEDQNGPPININEQLGALSLKESEVVKLHYLHGYSFKEVAAILKIESSNARKISSRAIEKLRSFWK